MIAKIAVASLALCFLVLMPQIVWAQQQSDHLAATINHPYFWDVTATSAVGWLMGILKGFSGSKEWVARYWSNPPVFLVFIMDVLIFVGVGGVFGTAVFDPTTLHAAIAAGLSWPIGLGSLATR